MTTFSFAFGELRNIVSIQVRGNFADEKSFFGYLLNNPIFVLLIRNFSYELQ